MNRLITAAIIFMAIAQGIFSQGFRAQRDLSVSEGETIPENVLVWKGEAILRGNLEQSLFIVNGKATISGHVTKDVIGFSSDIILEPGAVIKGELLLLGGSLKRGPDTRIEGEHLHFQYDLKRLRSTLSPVFSNSTSLGFFRAVKIIVWFVITLLTFVLFPRSVINAEGVLTQRGWRVGITGFGVLLAFISLTLLALLLSFVLIGIPMVFILILAWFAVLVLGRTVIFYAMGSRLIHWVGHKGSNVPLALLAGTLVFGILKFIPIMGTIALILLNLFEIGIGAVFLLNRIRNRRPPVIDRSDPGPAGT